MFLTSVPIICFGLFEQKVSIAKLEQNPYHYRTIKNNQLLSYMNFCKWNALAIWHSLVVFLFIMGIFTNGSSFTFDGKLCGSWEFGGLVITIIDIIVHIKVRLSFYNII